MVVTNHAIFLKNLIIVSGAKPDWAAFELPFFVKVLAWLRFPIISEKEETAIVVGSNLGDVVEGSNADTETFDNDTVHGAWR